jgi:hypothetical protein
MITGTVLSYNDQKGCGFIRPDNFEEDYSSTPPRWEGQEVKSDKGIDPRSGKAAVATIEIAQGSDAGGGLCGKGHATPI